MKSAGRFHKFELSPGDMGRPGPADLKSVADGREPKHTAAMRRSSLLVCIVAGAGLLVVVAWRNLPRVPMYRHRPVTDWVKDGFWTSSTQEELEQANVAVRATGTNALKFWVTMLGNTNDSIITEAGNAIFRQGSRFHRLDLSERRYLAFCALYILGADAKCAIPALTEVLNFRYVMPCAYATIILAGLGPEGVEIITNALASPNMGMRFWVAATLGGWNGKPPNHIALSKRGEGPWEWPEPVMKSILPALARALKDHDLNVRVFSAQSLGCIGRDADRCVPALAEYLARETNASGCWTCLEALAKFGTAAKPARSQIIGFLENSDLQTRRSATNALLHIDSKAGAE